MTMNCTEIILAETFTGKIGIVRKLLVRGLYNGCVLWYGCAYWAIRALYNVHLCTKRV